MINSEASGSMLYLLCNKYTQSQNCGWLVIIAALCSGEQEFDSLLDYLEIFQYVSSTFNSTMGCDKIGQTTSYYLALFKEALNS